MKKLIIFDLDGTLIDTLTDLQMSVNFALGKFHYPNRSLEQVRKDIGNGVAKLIERSISAGILDENYSKILQIFEEHYRENYANFTRPYDGVYDLLLRLKEEGYIVTVATNKIVDVAKHLLDKLYPGVFYHIQGDAPCIKKKPDPMMIDELIKFYGVSKEETLYVGDTNVDEQTALGAKVDYVLVTYGYRTKEEIKNMCQCTHLVDNTEELYQFIASLS